MKIKSAFILLFVFFTLTACSRKCENFNAGILNWFPYQKDDIIEMQEFGNESIKYFQVTRSEGHHTNKIAAGVKCTCENYFQATIEGEGEIRIDLIFTQQESNKNSILSEVYLNNNTLYMQEKLEEYELYGARYKDVMIFSSLIDSGIEEKVLLSKSVGIIAVYLEEDIFLLNNSFHRKIEISDISFYEQNC